MEETGTGKQKSAVFLLILLSHGLIVVSLIQNSRDTELAKIGLSEESIVYFFPQQVLPTADAPKPRNPSKTNRAGHVADRKVLPGAVLAVPAGPPVAVAPAVPPIDWQAQLELAAKHSATEADEGIAYRDLSKSMSSAQLAWLKDHHMKPASPGITWKEPRVEVTKDGLPIVHISDHCVLVPNYLIPMVFCSIGRIEPNGDLFKHMHDLPDELK